MPPRIASRLLIVGWDAADWKIIDPLLAGGKMPHLKRMIDHGARGNLSSLDPKLSPLLWTSIATGKTADKHGILNFIEPDPSGRGLRPSSSTTRRTKALWNILTQSGLRTSVVGWYASHPAEPIKGCIVSNLFQEGTPPASGEPWPMPPGSVWPVSQTGIADLRVHPLEISGGDLLALFPAIAGMDGRDPRIALLAKLVAQCASIHNVATALMASGEPWDCMLAFYETIDVAGHHFMQYYPPRMPHVSAEDFRRFQGVMPEIYMLQDAMLGRLLELAGPQATVILLSDHGFHSDHLRPQVQAAMDDPHAAMDATWHRPLGVLVLSGPGIRRGQEIFGANLLDIAPTALALLGLAVGADMDGRVLVEAIDRPIEVDRVFTWDDVPGEAGLHPPDLRIDPFDVRGTMAQLADLGYIGDLPPDSAAQAALCDRETRFNLGVVYMTTSRQGQAIPIFEALAREHPGDPRFQMNFAHCLYATGRFAESVAAIETLLSRFPDSPDAQLLKGGALFARGKIEEAAKVLETAVQRSPDRPDLLCTIADAYTRLKRWDEAEGALNRAAVFDPLDPVVHVKRAQLELARGRFEPAVEAALRAAELRHFLPEAHYILGVALTWMKDYEHAIQSFKVALSMQPGMIDAHRFIASIYRHQNDRSRAAPHREAAERLLKARADGAASWADVITEPPLGPQEWARQFLSPDPEG